MKPDYEVIVNPDAENGQVVSVVRTGGSLAAILRSAVGRRRDVRERRL